MTDAAHRLQPGDRAPALSLRDPAGAKVVVDPARHAATVVVFTSQGCPYALAWHDRIQDLGRDYAQRGVALVQVFSNDPELQPRDSAAQLAASLDGGAFVGRVLCDDRQAAAVAFGTTATPEVFVLDAQGVVRYHGAPDHDYDDPALRAGWVRAALDSVLAGQAPERESTPPAGCAIKWRVELLWWQGCPSHARAGELLATTLETLHRQDVRVELVEITSPRQAAERAFPGSPTFQVGGADLFPEPDAIPALACRTYRLDDGRVSPLPAAGPLQARLASALVRPWELPGWVDFRQQPVTS